MDLQQSNARVRDLEQHALDLMALMQDLEDQRDRSPRGSDDYLDATDMIIFATRQLQQVVAGLRRAHQRRQQLQHEYLGSIGAPVPAPAGDQPTA
jgi:hypothetical protein